MTDLNPAHALEGGASWWRPLDLILIALLAAQAWVIGDLVGDRAARPACACPCCLGGDGR